jgi:predicted helicase
MSAYETFFETVGKQFSSGDATEHTYRPALQNLLESMGAGIVATNEPKKIECGAPDFSIRKGNVPLGHVETKDLGKALDPIERGKGSDGEQFRRYIDGLPNWILTNYLEFRWYVAGQKRLTATLGHLDAKKTLHLEPKGIAEVGALVSAFLSQSAPSINTAKELAQRLAGTTRILRALITNTLKREPEKGWLRNWLAAFREVLIPTLDANQFADMFAQTLTYGLFAAFFHTPSREQFSRQTAAFTLPKTNKFLRKLFSEVGGVDLPDTMVWAVDEVVQLLVHCSPSVFEDFDNNVGKQDPVVHFYETFLESYDAKLREVRGIYYTPEPVVRYIVQSVDKILTERFHRSGGLADTKTLILDPAVGTGTFLYFVMTQVHDKFEGQAGAWDSYVDSHLLDRIFGFEVLIPPYAVAHLKLGMLLQHTGYKFADDKRLGVYLTNTLEDAAKQSEQLIAGWIAEEANAAASVKRDLPIMVVLGNPPYSIQSQNMSARAKAWVDPYRNVDGKPIKEKGALQFEKNIQDDYVKFTAFAQWRIDETGYGILAYITNHSYLDSPSFRGMRQSLMKSFSELYVLDLHGSGQRSEVNPTGLLDTNVFDIEQGVAISIFVKLPDHKQEYGEVRHSERWGSREYKYEWLQSHDVSSTNWTRLHPKSDTYLFIPQNEVYAAEWDKGWPLPAAMPKYSAGIITARDHVVIDTSPTALIERAYFFIDSEDSDGEVARHLEIPPKKHWDLARARRLVKADKTLEDFVKPVCYRPFDFRYIFYHPSLVWGMAFPTMKHMLAGENLGLLSARSNKSGRVDHFLVTNTLAETKCAERSTQSCLFPLYLYEDAEDTLFQSTKAKGQKTKRQSNLSSEFVKAFCSHAELDFVSDGRGDLKQTVGPEDIFAYAYALFHAPSYRFRYAEFFRNDFPRILLTRDKKLLSSLVNKGHELVQLHLLGESVQATSTFPVKGSNTIEKVRYEPSENRVWINDKQYFEGITKEVWDFYIGGYPVCDRWLKYRKDKQLTYQDILHLEKTVFAISETIRLMKEVDALIPEWPLA